MQTWRWEAILISEEQLGQQQALEQWVGFGPTTEDAVYPWGSHEPFWDVLLPNQ